MFGCVGDHWWEGYLAGDQAEKGVLVCLTGLSEIVERQMGIEWD